MAVVRWDPWAEFDQLQREVSDLFNRRTQTARAMRPAMDAYRTDEGTVVRMDVPGFSPADVQVEVQEGVLRLSGTRSTEEKVDDDAWIRRERTSATFERSIVLPKGIDVESITANVDNGVLEVFVPHPAEQQPRRISVTASGTESGGETVDIEEHSS